MNRIFLLGRLGNQPILRETKSGLRVAHFSLATSRRVKSKNEGRELDASAEEPSEATSEAESGTAGPEQTQYEEETQWHRVVVWGRLGELCAQRLQKGSTVFVEGSVRSHKYKSNSDPIQERIAFEVYAENVNFVNASAVRSTDEVVAQAS